MLLFARAKIPTPILNCADFASVFGGKDGASLDLDTQGLLRPVETIALPGTKFEILGSMEQQIVQVATRDYPGELLYVDNRFLEPVDPKYPERTSQLPTREEILERVKAMEGVTYIWGGNWSQGIPKLLELYPPKKPLNAALETIWTLRGVDCSGLLYQAADGATPRNTSALVSFGHPVPIAGKDNREIIRSLQPLDLIVWAGHVILVLDQDTLIESRAGRGVVRSDMHQRLQEIRKERTPLDSWASGPHFVIRRFPSTS